MPLGILTRRMGARGLYGAYSVSLPIQTTAGPGAGALFGSFRWAPTVTTELCAITRLTLSMAVAVTGAAGAPEMGFFFARGFTAPDTAGTTVTLTGDALKKRTSYPTTRVQDIRYGTNALVSAGTRTLAQLPLVSAAGGQGNSSAAVVSLDFRDEPLVLVNQEGLEVISVNALTTEVVMLAATIEWMEFSVDSDL